MGAPWWQQGVIYQIYPRSFADGDGDGIGDFPGMIDRLDYLQDLGIDALWLSPHYPSPQVDCGYDVADYVGVAPEYGTLADFERLLAEAHRRKIKVVVDLVVNHSSDRHPWFLESRSSRSSPKRGWYVWHPGRNGGPPTNWMSTFGGPAWTRDDATGEWYYHFFFKEQPDLNWHNPEVRAAMYDSVRYWLDLGVDGFRLDAIGTVFEDPDLPDHTSPITQAELLRMRMEAGPGRPYDDEQVREAFFAMFGHQVDRPEVHEVFRELRSVIDEYDARLLLGETSNLDYYGSGNDELHLVFNFPLMATAPLTPERILANQRERLAGIPPGGWPCNTLGNHDASRVFSCFGTGEHAPAQAKQSLALMLTLRGTPVLYNGEEIGMTDYLLDDPALFRDNLGVWMYETAVGDLGMPHTDAVRKAAQLSRDKCRTPMQWGPGTNAGFSPPDVATWLPVNPNHSSGINVAEQDDDPASLLNFYRRMLRLRRRLRPLIAGDYRPLEAGASCLAFERRLGRDAMVVAFNMSAQTHRVDLGTGNLTTEFSTHRPSGARVDSTAMTLHPWEIHIATKA